MDAWTPAGIVAIKGTLLSLIRARRLDTLPGRGRFNFVVPEEVRNELSAEDLRTADLAAYQNRLVWGELCGASPLRLYSGLRNTMSRSEAAALALASGHHFPLATDDMGHLALEARKLLGASRVINLAGLLFILSQSNSSQMEA